MKTEDIIARLREEERQKHKRSDEYSIQQFMRVVVVGFLITIPLLLIVALLLLQTMVHR